MFSIQSSIYIEHELLKQGNQSHGTGFSFSRHTVYSGFHLHLSLFDSPVILHWGILDDHEALLEEANTQVSFVSCATHSDFDDSVRLALGKNPFSCYVGVQVEIKVGSHLGQKCCRFLTSEPLLQILIFCKWLRIKHC